MHIDVSFIFLTLFHVFCFFQGYDHKSCDYQLMDTEEKIDPSGLDFKLATSNVAVLISTLAELHEDVAEYEAYMYKGHQVKEVQTIARFLSLALSIFIARSDMH